MPKNGAPGRIVGRMIVISECYERFSYNTTKTDRARKLSRTIRSFDGSTVTDNFAGTMVESWTNISVKDNVAAGRSSNRKRDIRKRSAEEWDDSQTDVDRSMMTTNKRDTDSWAVDKLGIMILDTDIRNAGSNFLEELLAVEGVHLLFCASFLK